MIEPGRPVVLRGGTVLTMNDAHEVLRDADVLVEADRITAVGPGLEVPEGAFEIDATDGIVMPGMVDTHRHMWQTALRGYGADWTLSQYFVFYYLEWGKIFRPQDIHAGNTLSAIESLDAGVTTTVDWSHGLQTVDHADAAVDALQAVPGRFVLAYGNLQQGPWEWATSPDFCGFVERRFGSLGREALVEKHRRERQDHFAEDVVLNVPCRRITDADGTVASVTRPAVDDPLVEIRGAVHAIQG